MRARLRRLLIDLLYLPAALCILPWIAFLILVRRRGVGSLGERLGGWRISRSARERIWVHAVSVGELRAAAPLLAELAAARPGAELVLSVTTTAALDLARERHPSLPAFLFPLDLSPCIRRVLGRVRPRAIVLVELEIWPNLLLESAERGIPVVVVNGRVSDRGARRLRRVAPLARPLFRRLAEVHARDAVSAERFAALGVPRERIHEVGNLKFDHPPLPDPLAVRERFEREFGYAPGSPRWIAGSTHPGEEEAVLAAHATLRARSPDLSLLLAPRHVERAAAVLALARERGLSARRAGEAGPAAPAVVVLDRVGALAELYAAGDVAFVGGSLVPHGGHNLLEPLLAGVAALHGPHTANFREQVELLAGGGAALPVSGTAELVDAVAHALDDPARRAERAERGLALIARSRGAARRSAARIAGLVDRSQSRVAERIP